MIVVIANRRDVGRLLGHGHLEKQTEEIARDLAASCNREAVSGVGIERRGGRRRGGRGGAEGHVSVQMMRPREAGYDVQEAGEEGWRRFKPSHASKSKPANRSPIGGRRRSRAFAFR